MRKVQSCQSVQRQECKLLVHGVREMISQIEWLEHAGLVRGFSNPIERACEAVYRQLLGSSAVYVLTGRLFPSQFKSAESTA